MTRTICMDHRSLLLDNQNEMQWEEWRLAETPRRTVHLVNVTNRLSYHIKEANPRFYEPLDDDNVLRMSLPAPDMLWKACTSTEFEAAKPQIGVERREMRTPRILLAFPGNKDAVDE